MPRVRLRIRGKHGRELDSVCLFRNVYRIGSQENLVDLRLKARGVRPLHAILIVERDSVMIMPYEHAPVLMPGADMNMIPVEHLTPLRNGQSFDLAGVRFTLEEVRPNDVEVNVPAGIVPIEDLPVRFPDPPMSGRSSPARNRNPRRLVSEDVHHRFTSETAIASLRSSHSEEHEEIQPLDSSSSSTQAQPPPRRRLRLN